MFYSFLVLTLIHISFKVVLKRQISKKIEKSVPDTRFEKLPLFSTLQPL